MLERLDVLFALEEFSGDNRGNWESWISAGTLRCAIFAHRLAGVTIVVAEQDQSPAANSNKPQTRKLWVQTVFYDEIPYFVRKLRYGLSKSDISRSLNPIFCVLSGPLHMADTQRLRLVLRHVQLQLSTTEETWSQECR